MWRTQNRSRIQPSVIFKVWLQHFDVYNQKKYKVYKVRGERGKKSQCWKKYSVCSNVHFSGTTWSTPSFTQPKYTSALIMWVLSLCWDCELLFHLSSLLMVAKPPRSQGLCTGVSMAVSALSLWLCCCHIGKVLEEARCYPDALAPRPTGAGQVVGALVLVERLQTVLGVVLSSSGWCMWKPLPCSSMSEKPVPFQLFLTLHLIRMRSLFLASGRGKTWVASWIMC